MRSVAKKKTSLSGGTRNQRENQRGGAMVFALVAVAVVGLLAGAYFTQSQDWLQASRVKSLNQELEGKANANYARLLPAVLQAYQWAVQVRAGSTELPQAPFLLEAYSGDLQAVMDWLQACESPCMPTPEFLSHIFPGDRAAKGGWRYQVIPQQNANLEGGSWPKRFTLNIFQTDLDRPGYEVRLSGQFQIAPTNLSAFGALAYGISFQPLLLVQGDHQQIGLFFEQTNEKGEEIVFPEGEDCTSFSNHGQPPELNSGTIYFAPKTGTSLNIDLLVTNVPISNQCYGVDQATQHGYNWSHGNSVGQVRVGGTVIAGSVGSDIEVAMRANHLATLQAIQSQVPFVPPVDAGGSVAVITADDYKPIESVDSFNEYYAYPAYVEATSYESKKVVVESDVISATPQEAEVVEELSEVPQENATEEKAAEEKAAEETAAAEATEPVVSCGADWRLSHAELKLGACINPSSCSVSFADVYVSDCRGSTYTHTIYSGNVGSLPVQYNGSLATMAPLTYVDKAAGVSGSQATFGLKNLTVYGNGSFVLKTSLIRDPGAVDPPRGDLTSLGHLALVNVGTGPAVKLVPDTMTLQGSTLGGIKSGVAQEPSSSTESFRVEAGLFAVGSATDKTTSSPVALESSLMEIEASNHKTFGKLVLVGPNWSPQLSQTRMMSPDLSSVVAGFEEVSTEFPDSWEKNSLMTNIETSMFLQYSEISRSSNLIEADVDERFHLARQSLGIE